MTSERMLKIFAPNEINKSRGYRPLIYVTPEGCKRGLGGRMKEKDAQEMFWMYRKDAKGYTTLNYTSPRGLPIAPRSRVAPTPRASGHPPPRPWTLDSKL